MYAFAVLLVSSKSAMCPESYRLSFDEAVDTIQP